MKISKLFICAALTAAIGTCSSTVSIGESRHIAKASAGTQAAVSSNETEEGDFTSGKSVRETPFYRSKAYPERITDDKILIKPGYNCDPKMIIPGNPNIDPHFLIELKPEK